MLNTSGQAEAADSPCQQSMQEINHAADTMSHLVQDLLLLARSDAGQLGKDPLPLPLRELLERAIAGVSVATGATIALTLEDETLRVMGNGGELQRLFSNLLENAARYTPPEGKIEVRARRQGEHALICIADTGGGIAPQHLPHLGERFYRVDSSRTRPTGGTGLGLSICKGIAEAHRGTMTFASVEGTGTTVSVVLPLATP